MVTFLFWNLNRNRLETVLANLVQLHQVDVLMLAESTIPPARLLVELNKVAGYHYSPNIGCTKIQLYSLFSRNWIQPVYETDRTTIRHLTLPGLRNVLLAVTHLPSRLHWSENSLGYEGGLLANEVRQAEEQVGHTRTVLVGDLNMNPFDAGVVSAGGLHATMSKEIAKRERRTVQGRTYPFFYNPMWNFLGDETAGPPGTYYYGSSEHTTMFWNMFDQVLIRPELIEHLDMHSVRVLQDDSVTSFATSRGIPDNAISDHFPVLFELAL